MYKAITINEESILFGRLVPVGIVIFENDIVQDVVVTESFWSKMKGNLTLVNLFAQIKALGLSLGPHRDINPDKLAEINDLKSVLA